MRTQSPSRSWLGRSMCCGLHFSRLSQEGHNKLVLLQRSQRHATAGRPSKSGLTVPSTARPHPRRVSRSRSSRAANHTAAGARLSRWMTREQAPGRTSLFGRVAFHSRHGYARSDTSTLVETRPARPRSYSIRRQLRAAVFLAGRSSCRPQISAPTDFRHLESSTFVFPVETRTEEQPEQQAMAQESQPIENTASPPSPSTAPSQRDSAHHDDGDTDVREQRNDETTVSPRAVARGKSRGENKCALPAVPPQRPQRPVELESIRLGSFTSDRHEHHLENRSEGASPPVIPELSRLRSQSLPAVVGRVNDLPQPWMLFPSTFHETPTEQAVPADAPSFAERIRIERPQTAPPLRRGEQQRRPRAVMQSGSMTFAASIAAAASREIRTRASESRRGPIIDIASPSTAASNPCNSMDNLIDDHAGREPMTPSLPLIVRPPLRKKKSFFHETSRLSTYQGHSSADNDHTCALNFDSVTTTPALTLAATITTMATPMTTPALPSDAGAPFVAVADKVLSGHRG
ncbi:hypothetical protein SEPCBS119000_005741 [Sporothrix epigloea]|uniref:Uncharacterized protein n=1 Tax=Sporothrix epigloea TaxID=1892477 RepID=A0ABP0E3A7_9PEZI